MGKKVKFVNGEMVEYEIRSLVDFYDPILRKPTQPVDLQQLTPYQILYYVYSMAMMMEHYQHALGLSANQVGWDLRMCAINLGNENIILINPEIVEASEPTLSYYEGCVSYPGLYIKIPRSLKIKVKYQTPTGNWNEQEVEGLTAICIQHELDHLNGIVYTDKVSPINLEKAKRKVKTNLKKMKKFAAARKVQQEIMSQETPAAPQILQTTTPQILESVSKSTPQVLELPKISIPEELQPQQTSSSFVYKTAYKTE